MSDVMMGLLRRLLKLKSSTKAGYVRREVDDTDIKPMFPLSEYTMFTGEIDDE